MFYLHIFVILELKQQRMTTSDKKGFRLKMTRQSLQITQLEFCKSYGKFISEKVEQSSMSRFENGTSKIPVELLEYLSIIYNVNVDYIVTGQGNMFKTKTKSKEQDLSHKEVLRECKEIKERLTNIEKRILMMQVELKRN